MPQFLVWLMKEDRFGAARFADELGGLISATCAQLEMPSDFEQVLLQLSERQLLYENQYVELYDSNLNRATRKSRVAHVTEFMQCALESVLKDGYLNLWMIDDFLCMGFALEDDMNSYTVSEEIKTSLYSYITSRYITSPYMTSASRGGR